VSVVIATYNCQQYVGAAIASVLAQTYARLELHVVDDGSTDQTIMEVARFVDDPRVHYHRQPNAGHAVAKNRGIDFSRGEFVGFCDADDMWRPDKLALQLARFAGNDRVGVVYSRTALMNEDGAPLLRDRADEPVYPSGRVTDDLFKINFVPFGTALVRRRCFDELGPFDPRHGTSIDWELWLRLSLHYDFAFVEEETHVYRVWPGQMSKNWQRLYEHAFGIMREFVARHPGAVAPATVPEYSTLIPRLSPPLIPLTSKSGFGQISESASFTQSAGLPSTAHPRRRSPSKTSFAMSGLRNVIECPTPLCSTAGATTLTLPKRERARSIAARPGA